MKKIVIGFVGAAIFFYGIVRYLESSSLFYPVKELAYKPSDFGLAHEDVRITTSDNVRLHGWFVPAEGAKATIVFLHGNAGNIGDRVDKIKVFNQMGLNVLMVDYRGYGKSEGSPSEKGLHLDALAIFDSLKTHSGDLGKIIVYGSSLGGVYAIELATQRQVDGLIIDSSFTSAKDMAKIYYPFVPSFMLSVKLDSTSKIRTLTVPKLFLHSQGDEVVPYRLGQKLFNEAAMPKIFADIEGAHVNGHNDPSGAYRTAIKQFIGGLL